MVEWNTRKEFVERYGIEKYILRCIKNREQRREKWGYKGTKRGRPIKYYKELLNDTEKLRALERAILEENNNRVVGGDTDTTTIKRDAINHTNAKRTVINHTNLKGLAINHTITRMDRPKEMEDGKNGKNEK